MITCTFAGHRTVLDPDIDRKIDRALSELLQKGEKLVFLSGGMGEFDQRCESAVRALKRAAPGADITLLLILPYMTNRINTEKDYYDRQYDDVIFPDELTGLHYKVAIGKRNRWMAEQADVVLSFVRYDHGGAYDMVRYARKIGKRILNMADAS